MLVYEEHRRLAWCHDTTTTHLPLFELERPAYAWIHLQAFAYLIHQLAEHERLEKEQAGLAEDMRIRRHSNVLGPDDGNTYRFVSRFTWHQDRVGVYLFRPRRGSAIPPDGLYKGQRIPARDHDNMLGPVTRDQKVLARLDGQRWYNRNDLFLKYDRIAIRDGLWYGRLNPDSDPEMAAIIKTNNAGVLFDWLADRGIAVPEEWTDFAMERPEIQISDWIGYGPVSDKVHELAGPAADGRRLFNGRSGLNWFLYWLMRKDIGPHVEIRPRRQTRVGTSETLR